MQRYKTYQSMTPKRDGTKILTAHNTLCTTYTTATTRHTLPLFRHLLGYLDKARVD